MLIAGALAPFTRTLMDVRAGAPKWLLSQARPAGTQVPFCGPRIGSHRIGTAMNNGNSGSSRILKVDGLVMHVQSE